MHEQKLGFMALSARLLTGAVVTIGIGLGERKRKRPMPSVSHHMGASKRRRKYVGAEQSHYSNYVYLSSRE